MAKHLDDNGIELRCVYLAEFTDDYCYVGTANDFGRRIGDHLFADRHSEVFQHKRHTGLVPKFTMLHNYTSIEEADKLEYYYTIEYAKLGKKILNVQKPGGYGHKESSQTSSKKLEGKVLDYSNLKESKPVAGWMSHRNRHKGDFTDSIQKVHDILVYLCKRVYKEGGERVYIKMSDFPYLFDWEEFYSYNKKNRYCAISYVWYQGENQKSYMECCDFDERIGNFVGSCQHMELKEMEEICDELYKKCYVFKNTQHIKEYFDENWNLINDEVVCYLRNHNITAPFNVEVEVEQFGYKEHMVCSRTDYAVMLSRLGGFCSPSFDVKFDEKWNVSSLCLSVSYNSYSMWAKLRDSHEMQDEEMLSKFSKLIAKIDNYIYSQKEKIKDYPTRIEFLAKDLRIADIDILKSFMRHFYVTHGTGWDTPCGDLNVCSVMNYNGNNMRGCKFIIDIQSEHFFHYYDLKNHVLDKSERYLKSDI